MSELTRRLLIQLPGIASALQAQEQGHDHDHGSQSTDFKRPARKVFFTDHEFATLEKLCDCILPADEVSPAASAAGAPEYIELLSANNSKLAQIFHGGLAWLNTKSRALNGADFGTAPLSAQVALLQNISQYPAGVEVFDWARRLTIDAFYTTPYGYKDVDYRGGKGMTTYTVPQAAIDQALRKANLK